MEPSCGNGGGEHEIQVFGPWCGSRSFEGFVFCHSSTNDPSKGVCQWDRVSSLRVARGTSRRIAA